MSQRQSNFRLDKDQYHKALMFCFNYFDHDKDGHLDRKEFRAFLGSLKNKLNFTLTTQISDHCFQSIHKKREGLISPKELENEMQHFYYNVNF